jgi:starch phosphorylase
MPLELIKNSNDDPLIVSVNMPMGEVYCYIWRLQVGRISLIFLDTNIKENKSDQVKKITNALYGGDREKRIQKEVI